MDTGFVSAIGVTHRGPTQLRKLPEPEASIWELWVRDREPRLRHGLLIENHDVEVECARPPTLITRSAGAILDPVQGGEQLFWRKLGYNGNHLVQKRTLFTGADRRGLFHFRFCQQSRSWQRRDGLSCIRQKYFATAKVGAERYICNVSHTRSRSIAISA